MNRDLHFGTERPTVCIKENCETKVHARGMCLSHYAAYRRKSGGKLTFVKKTCSICPVKHFARGLCQAHYMQAWKAAKVLETKDSNEVSQ